MVVVDATGDAAVAGGSVELVDEPIPFLAPSLNHPCWGNTTLGHGHEGEVIPESTLPRQDQHIATSKLAIRVSSVALLALLFAGMTAFPSMPPAATYGHNAVYWLPHNGRMRFRGFLSDFQRLKWHDRRCPPKDASKPPQ